LTPAALPPCSFIPIFIISPPPENHAPPQPKSIFNNPHLGRALHHQPICHRYVFAGVSSIASASIGLFDSPSLLPVVLILATTSWTGLAILVVGRRKLPRLRFVEEKGATPLAH
jgi:hypothetical protein